jgi:hypothetical protein
MVMPKQLAVLVEMGPKRKRFAAFARDWPGLERGGKTAEEAVAALKPYVARYGAIARRAGREDELAVQRPLRVIDSYEGPGSTDFWGVSFGIARTDRAALSDEELNRQLDLLEAVWAEFDSVGKRVSAELRKGPRGGGRDRASVVRHVLMNEEQWAKQQLRMDVPVGSVLTSKGLRTHRRDFVKRIRELHSAGEPARRWPIRYLIRHTAYHNLDHAWEMEDKDLSRS